MKSLTQEEQLTCKELACAIKPAVTDRVWAQIHEWTIKELKESIDSGHLLKLNGVGKTIVRRICEVMNWETPKRTGIGRNSRIIIDTSNAPLLIRRFEPLPSPCLIAGIYALYRGETLLYIGQARSIWLRIGQHVAFINFDSVRVLIVKRYSVENPLSIDEIIDLSSTLTSYELSLIHYLKPPHNKETKNLPLPT